MSYQVVGQWLSKVGRTSGWTRGQITQTCQYRSTNPRLLCHHRTNIWSEEGDSGSPIFYEGGSGSGDSPWDWVYVAGILWGGPFGQWDVTDFGTVQGIDYDLPGGTSWIMSRWMRCRGIVGIGVVGMMIVVACSAPTESEEGEVLRPGKFYRFGPNVLAPDTVQVGQSFEVIILTQGDGCYRKGVSKVRLSPDEVIIRPYDYVDTTPETCARVLRVFEHEVEGEFAQSGEGKVVVWGVDPTYFHPVRLEHVIVVVGSDP